MTRRRARLVADEPLHGQLQAQLVVGEADARSGLGIGDEGDLIERTQAIDEALCGGHDRAQRTGPDVDLIDRDDDLPAVGRRQVARVERLALVGHLPLRRLDIHLDQLGRDHAAHLAVDLHREVWRAKILDGTPVSIHHRNIDGRQIHTGSERRPLDGLRRLSWLRRLGCLRRRRRLRR